MKIATLSCFSNSNPQEKKPELDQENMKRSKLITNIRRLFKKRQNLHKKQKELNQGQHQGQYFSSASKTSDKKALKSKKVVEKEKDEHENLSEEEPLPDSRDYQAPKIAILKNKSKSNSRQSLNNLNTTINFDEPQSKETEPAEEQDLLNDQSEILEDNSVKVENVDADQQHNEDTQEVSQNDHEEPSLETEDAQENIEPNAENKERGFIQPAQMEIEAESTLPKPSKNPYLAKKLKKPSSIGRNDRFSKPVSIEYPTEIPKLEISKIPVRASSPKFNVPSDNVNHLNESSNPRTNHKQDTSKLVELARIIPKSKIKPPSNGKPTTAVHGKRIMLKPLVTSTGRPNEPRIINGPGDNGLVNRLKGNHEKNFSQGSIPANQRRTDPRSSLMQPGFATQSYKTAIKSG